MTNVTPSSVETDSWRRKLLLCAGLGVLILVFYANSFSAGLTLDNRVVIANDIRLQKLDYDHLKLIFTRNYWWPNLESDLYRPLTTLSYMFNYLFLQNGEHVASYHVVNFLLHWANACLVLLVLRRLSGRLDVAVVAAALFAVHPVNTESVTNIVGRADLLATLAILLGGWCYLRAAEARGWKKAGWLAGMGVVASLGMLCKESAVMICAFVALYDALWRWPQLPAANWRARLVLAAKEFGLKGYVVLAPAVLLLWSVRRWMASTTPVYGQVFVDNPLVGATPLQSFLTAMGVIGRYLGRLVFPWTLSSDYSYHQIPLYGEAGNTAGDILAWCSIALVIALLVAAVLLRRRQMLFSWGVLFFFGMLLPTANLVFPIGSIMGERFLYLPSIGFCAVAALAFCQLPALLGRLMKLPPTRPGLVKWSAATLAIGALGLRTYARNIDWHDNVSLWASTIAASPNSFKSYKGYGTALWNAALDRTPGGDEPSIDAAIAQAEKGLAVLDQTPLPIELQDNTLFQDLGMYYRIKGQFLEKHTPPDLDGARAYYQKSVAVLMRAIGVDHYADAASHKSQLQRGRPLEDIADVGNFHVYENIGLTYFVLKDWPDCITTAHYIQHLQPNERSGYLLAGQACFNSGRPYDAAVQFLEGLLLNAKDEEIINDLTTCYKTLGAPPGAIEKTPTGVSLGANDIPLVRQQLNEAAASLVQGFEDAKRRDDAQTLRNMCIKQFNVPPELLTAK